MQQWRPGASCLFCLVTLVGCGGGGGSSNSNSIVPEAQVAQQCAPDNTYRADASSATTTGSLTTEKTWIRSYFDAAYLWYDQVPSVDPAATAYSGSMVLRDSLGVPLPLSNYFHALKTTAVTESGARRDRFSFAYPTYDWNQLSQSGITAGYGIEWVRIASNTLPRSWRVAIVQPNSPAAIAGIRRGDSLLTVDGVDFINGNTTTIIDTLNAGLFPSAGTSHTLGFSRSGGADVTAAMTASTSVTIDPVPVATVLTDGALKVGYLHFTDHLASSETKLIAAINNFKTQGVTDLVLDLRYNGGGYLYLSSEMAYMIAGASRTSGKVFEKLTYNGKRTSDNARTPTPFYNTSCNLDANYICSNQQSLPTLNLPRVFVIAKGDTCSASESIINSLKGIDVEVILIGGTTCGKPYGFTAHDNCGVSYFPIEFKGANHKGFGDYADGFTPVTANTSNTNLPGCPTTDDLDHALGDTSERMLATALQRLNAGTCLAAPAGGTSVQAGLSLKHQMAPPAGELARVLSRQSRVLLPPGSGR
jgi:carboxyl-terminal processing protease